MQLIAFFTERTVIVRILDHIGEASRAPRVAPIRGPPSVDVMQQRDDRGARRFLNLDASVDVMPDDEKPEPGSGLVSEFDPTRRELSAAATPTHVRKTAKAPRESLPTDLCGAVRCQ